METGTGSPPRACSTDGVVIASPRRSPLPHRLHQLHLHIADLIARHQPTALALENAFYHKNVQTTLVLGHARGVILLAAAQAGLAIAQYPPATVKKTVAGAGGAPKAQVGAVVARLLKLTRAPTPSDAADGVAVALTHIFPPLAGVDRPGPRAAPPPANRPRGGPDGWGGV